MSNNAQENVQAGDKLVNSLLQVNKLLYKMPPQIGIASRRNHRTDFFQQSSYASGEVMVLDSQTGSDFIDGKNSYLKLLVNPVGAGASWISGSVANIFNRVVVRSRTGKEVCRLENANILMKYVQIYDCPKDWRDTLGSSQGYSDGSATIPDAGRVYILPMWAIPCFMQDKLMPPQLMEGLRIEITLESPGIAFDNAGVVTDYAVTRPECHWDTFDLADQMKRKIAEMASRQGLNLIHKEYFHTIVSGSNAQTQFNFDIKKAASKALKVLIVTRDQAVLADANEDSMGSLEYDYTRQQLHIGSDYFPNQPLETDDPSADGNAESYYNTMFAFGKTDQCWYPPSVDQAEYTGAGTLKNSLIAYNLNKSQVSDLAGYVVNNSRAVLVDLTADTNAIVRRLDVYLQHLRAAKVFTSNVEIRD